MLNEPQPTPRSGRRETIVETARVISLRVAAAAAALGLNALVAMQLGAAGASVFYVHLALATIASVIGRVGLDNLILRDMSIYHNDKDSHGLFGAIFGALRLAAIAHLAVLALLAGFGRTLAHEGSFFTLAASAVFATSLSAGFLLASYFRAVDRYVDATLVSGLIYPVAGIILIAAATMVSTLTPAMAIALNATAALLAAVWGGSRLLRDQRRALGKTWPTANALRGLFRCSLPFWQNAVVNRGLLPWAPILLLGWFGTEEQAGIFGVASRVSLVTSMLMVALTSVVAPRYARAHHAGNSARVRRLAVQFSFVMIALTLPMIVVILSFDDQLMALFGPSYANHGGVLSLLAVGNLCLGVAGIWLFSLTMTGAEVLAKRIALTTFIVLIVTVATFLPELSAHDAALAVCIAFAANLFMQSALSLRRLSGGGDEQ